MSTINTAPLGDLSTSEGLFATLKAERSMHETYLVYLDIIDKRQPCQLAGECFTEDAEIAYHMKGTPMVFHSRTDYVTFLEHATAAQEMTAHVVGQTRFDWASGKPRLLSYVTSWQWFKVNAHLGDVRPADFTTIGYCEDDFEYAGGRWLISRRIVRPAAGLVAMGAPPPPLD
jgi:hypothetical protein